MLKKERAVLDGDTEPSCDSHEWHGERWSRARLVEHAEAEGRCVLLLGGFAVDVSEYLQEHVRRLVLVYLQISDLTINAPSLEELPCSNSIASSARTTAIVAVTA